MGEFGSKYAKSTRTKYCGHNTANKKKVNRQKEKNDIVNHAVDEIIPKENNKVSDEEELLENIEYELYENDLYQIDNMSLYDKK